MSYSTSYSTFSDKKSNKERPSKVLLICVYQTIIFQLNNQIIFDKFKIFGNIIKILIFEKGQVTKFFIEFADLEQASKAKIQLDGSKFFQNICKMNIYFSNFNNVDLKNQSTQGVNYQAEQQKKSSFVQNFDILTKSSQEQNIDFLDDQMLMQTFSSFGSSNSFVRSKTDNPKTLQFQIQKMKSSQKFNMIEEEDVDYSIKNQIQSLLSEGDFNDNVSSKSINSLTSSPKKHVSVNITKNQNLGAQTDQRILVYDLIQYVQLRKIYNLFSNFGNIELIVSKKFKVYIKFRSGYFAAVALNYLNGKKFFSNYLNLRYCQNEQELVPRPLQYSQCIYFEQSFDRFTAKRSITVNPPSQVLHVSSIKKQNCNEKSLRKIFQIYGRVQKIKILMQSNQKNMALIKFNSLNQSFLAISDLHNKLFGGRKMQISFTKSKL